MYKQAIIPTFFMNRYLSYMEPSLKISCHEPHAEACSSLEEDLVFPLTQVNHGLSWAKDALLWGL